MVFFFVVGMKKIGIRTTTMKNTIKKLPLSTKDFEIGVINSSDRLLFGIIYSNSN